MSSEYVEGEKPQFRAPIRGGNVERNKFTPSFLGIFFMVLGIMYLPLGTSYLLESLTAREVTADTPYISVGEIGSSVLTISVGIANLLLGFSSLWLKGRKNASRTSLLGLGVLMLGLILSMTIPDSRIDFKEWITQRYGIEEFETRTVPEGGAKIIYDENKLATIHQENGEYLIYDANDEKEIPLKK